MAPEKDAIAVWRAGLGAGYACLLATNWASMAQKLGNDNRTSSNAYPTFITPAGFAFAIWGPIYLLQGAGTAAMALGGMSDKTVEAVAPYWLGTWASQSVWLMLFSQAPVPAESASAVKRVAILGPSYALLLASQWFMVNGAMRQHKAITDGDAGSALSAVARFVMVDFPTGLNAGWLGAAQGVGLLMLLNQLPGTSFLTSPTGSSALLGAVACSGMAASVTLGGDKTPGIGLGFAAATTWACNGISVGPNATPEVQRVASLFKFLAMAAGVASLFGPAKKWMK